MLKWSFFLFDKHTTKFFDDVEALGGKKLVLSTIFSSHHFRESKSKNNKILPPLYPGDISLISVESRKSLTKKNRSSIGWSSSSSGENVSFSHQNHYHEFVLSTLMSLNHFHEFVLSTFSRSEVIEKSRFLFAFKLHLQVKMTKCNSQSRDSISTKEKFQYALIWNKVLRLCKRLKSAFY